MSRQNLLLQFFRGRWKYQREITSSTHGLLLGSGHGIATFVALEAEQVGKQAQDASSQFLLFREKGPFKMEGAGGAVDATKQQIWEFLPSGGDGDADEQARPDINVYFTLAPKTNNSKAADPDSREVSGYDIDRFFHGIKFSVNVAQAALRPQTISCGHWCSPDQYDGTFEIVSANQWSSSWDVTGPRKAYVIKTLFERDD